MATPQEIQFILKMRDEASRILQQFNQNAGQTGSGVDQLATKFDRLAKSARDLTIAFGGGALITKVGGDVIKSYADYETRATNIQKVINASKGEMAAFNSTLDATARNLSGINADELQDLSATAVQLGVRGSRSILQFATTMAKLNVATNVHGQEGASQVASILQLTNSDMSEVGKLGDILTAMGNNLGGLRGGEQSILDNATLLAQATSKFKLSYQDILAISGAGAKLQFKPELFGSVIGRTLNQLENAAVNNTKAMRHMNEATGETADAFAALIDKDPAQALEKFLQLMKATADSGGSMQQFLQEWNLYAEENQRVLGTLSQQNQARKLALDLMRQQVAIGNPQARALQQEYDTVNDTLNNNIKNYQDSLMLLQKDVGEAFSPIAKGGLKLASAAMDAFSETLRDLSPTSRTVAVSIAGIAAAAIPLAATIRLVGAAFSFGLPVIARSATFLTSTWAVLSRGFVGFIGASRTAVTVLGSLEGSLFSAGAAASILTTRLGPVVATLAKIGGAYAAIAGAMRLVEGAKGNEKKYTTGFGVQDLIEHGGDKLNSMWKGYDNAASMQFEEAMKNEEARKKKMAQVQRLVDDSNVGGFDLNEGKKFTVPLRLIEEQQNNIEKLDTWTKQKDQINEYRVALDQLAKISSKQEAGRGSAVDSKEQQRLETLFSVAKRLADPYERRVYDLEREQALTGAVTKEQKNQLEINDAILDIKETKGRIDDEEAKRLTAVLQKTQAIRAAAEAANQDYTLTKQMEAARQRSSLGQQQVQIEQAIADLIKEQGISLEDQLSLRQKMTDVANLEAFNQLADTADPVTAAIRSWVDNTRRLKDAYDTGLIPSAEKYAQMQQNLDRQTLSSRDPFGARLKTMREELQVAQFIGQQADIETDIQSDLNALKDQNVAVSKEQEQALRDYITSMYQLKVAQEASLQAWANGLGTWQEQLGHLQMSTADAVSDGLVDGFMDGDWKSAAAGMLKSIAKTYLKNGIDSFMAGIITKTGVGDNGGKDAFANAKKAAGQFGTLGQNALNANVAYVNTTSVVLQGPGIANITGAAPLGAVTRGGALKDLKGDIVSEVLNAGSGEGSLRGVGNFSKAGIQNVDPRLTAILSEAAKRSGMQVEAYSGYRAGDPRFHGQGLATDVRILDQAGKPIGGTNGNYQNPATFRQYELYAQNAKVAQQQMYPELNQQFRWGGYFGGTRGTYGAMDQMHFDLGGSRSAGMAGGSWQNGLNWGQKANFPGAQSMGIGQLQGSLNSLKTQFLGASTAATSAGANVSSFGQNVQQTGPAAQTAGNNVQQMNTKLNSTTPTVAGFGGAVSTSGSAAAGATQGFAGLGQGLGGLFSSIGGSLGGGAGAGLGIFGQLLGFMFHHNGGMAGHGTPGLSFGGSWRSAPKFHTGGGNNMGNDEYRAVLKQGERVLTADDDKRTAKLLKGRSGGSSTVGGVNVGGVNVTVNAGPSTGDKSRDDEHAKNMGKQVGNAVDQHMTEWVLNQMRPGGLFSTAAKR